MGSLGASRRRLAARAPVTGRQRWRLVRVERLKREVRLQHKGIKGGEPSRGGRDKLVAPCTHRSPPNLRPADPRPLAMLALASRCGDPVSG